MTTSHALQSNREPSNRLRLLSYNVQMGISSSRPVHYITGAWKHLLPTDGRLKNLNRIAEQLHGYDIVALQEIDCGSHRTGNVNLTKHIAEQAHFSFWHHQTNRNLGRVAQHGNAILSRFRPRYIEERPLPGRIPGRGVVMARYGTGSHYLLVVLIHLALGKKARLRQLEYVRTLVTDHQHVVVMGDLNCEPDGVEMQHLLNNTNLIAAHDQMNTFPSWRPKRSIDHILVSSGLQVSDRQVLKTSYSDHLPVIVELLLPDTLAAAIYY